MIARHLPTPAQLAPWRVRLGYAVALLYAWLARPGLAPLVLGGLIAAIGLLIRGAAAGHLQKNQRLTVSGPYAYTRNPLYFGSALLAAGLVVAADNWIAALVVVTYVLVFYPAVMKFEAEHLRSLHGQAYDDYAALVPLFLPRLTPAPGLAGESAFSWELYKVNREHQAALGAAAAIGLLALKMLFWPWG